MAIERKANGWRARPFYNGEYLKGYAKTFKAKGEAKAYCGEVLAKCRAGTLSKLNTISAVTLEQALGEYWDDIGCYKAGAAQLRLRINQLKLTRIAALPLQSIGPSDILDLQNELLKTKAPSTVINDLNPLSGTFQYACVKHDAYDLRNPCKDVKKPSTAGNSRDRKLSWSELRALITACDMSGNQYLGQVVRFAMEIGLRQARIVGLKWSQVDFSKQVVRYVGEPMPGNKRVPPFAPFTVRMERILNHMQPVTGGGVYVFPTSQNAIRLAFHKAKKVAGIDDFRFHDLRHYSISSMVNAGLDDLHIMLFTGIKSAQTLKRYAQPDEAAMVALRRKRKRLH